MGLCREHGLSWLPDHLVGGDEIEAIRNRVVQRATGHVIEIGSGAGANFLCYSDSITSLTTVDSNARLNKVARRRIKYLAFPVDTRELNCDALPMKEACFDSAVTTLTLCSLADVEKCLREIHRVLKPGGRLLFLEHGLSDSAAVGRWQRRISPLQGWAFDGCSLNRPIDTLIANVGFTVEEIATYYLRRVPRPFGYMYEGVAVK